MITIKYDGEEKKHSGKLERGVKNEEKKEGTGKRGTPKNIRQIGEPSKYHRIYVEDYVVTYLNQLSHPTNRIARGAILLGEWVKEGQSETLYISGAVEAQNLSFDMKEISFSNESWTSIYTEIETFFPGMSVVGWFLSRLGYSTALSTEIEQAHKRYFAKDKTVLYLADALEQEETFYIAQGGALSKVSGYYIYYERNTPMQDYLVEQNALHYKEEQEENLEYKDSQVLHSYHEIMAGRRAQKDEKKVTKLLYVTSAMLTIVFLSMGITIFSSYDHMKQIRDSLEFLAGNQSKNKEKTTSLSDSVESAQDSVAQAKQDDAQGQSSSEQPENAVQGQASEQVPDNTAAQEEEMSGEAQTVQDTTTAETASSDTGLASQNNEKTVQALSSNVANYYTVQNGDTLLSICQRVYHSDAYIDIVKKANEMQDGDVIYPGQRIVLPSVE